MKTEHITAKRIEKSNVVCRRRVFETELAGRRESFLKYGCIVFTDENVHRIYGRKIRKYLAGIPVHIMPAGEESKSEQTLFALLAAMAEAGLRRNSTLIALGGGVVGDIGGLAASLYMRGIDCIQVPTTVLAQVDSSVGGKTAIDFHGVKNLIGAFKQPEYVFADPTFFNTLPAREIRCGLGEIIKHGALNGDLFELLWENRDKLTDLGFLAEIVPQNIAYKAKVVKADPHEKGIRKSLNLGHTTAHALELSGADLSHGECVLVGIVYEARIAKKFCECDGEYLTRLEELCLRVLDADIKFFDLGNAAHLARLDKKNVSSDKIVLTAPIGKGEYTLLELPYEDYVCALAQIREELC